jgi:hypothetical protein
MDPILDKARGQQNVLEKLVNYIPGFKGYNEKELRRDADRLQREYLASRLDEAKKYLDQIANAVSRSGALDAINDVETARKRLDKVANRIRYADRGYAGFFDVIKVDETALDRVYRFDLALVDNVEAARAAAAAAPNSPNVAEGVRTLISHLDVMDNALADRESILAGIR